MKDLVLKLCGAAEAAFIRDRGQNLVEYSMAVGLIAFGCVAGETAIASSVNQTFVSISTVITTGVTR